MKLCITLLTLLACQTVSAQEQNDVPVEGDEENARRPAVTPDLRGEDAEFTIQKGDFIGLPVPFSNPTLDTGLVVAGAYFYSQTEAQKEAQPASVTAVAAMYSSNDSIAYGIGHQQYWDEDRWRFSGAFGRADLNLRIFAEDETGLERQGDWLLDGLFLYGNASRMTWRDWYAGLAIRIADVDQQFTFSDEDEENSERSESKESGLGVTLEFDRRDMPFNSYAGNQFQFQALFNSTRLGGDTNYQSYSATYSAYHQLREPLVFAWTVDVCARSGDAPLWDACRIDLRGFGATDYLGTGSVSGQGELRWKASKRWGFVAFAGAGYLTESTTESRERDIIPSYGVGVRFMVLPAKRINLRLDYARSTDSDAFHLSVTEAF